MAVNPDFRDLFAELSDHDARFLVVGAHAVIYYTTPRYTKDIDLWIDTSPENARRVYAALALFGAPLHELTVEDLSTPGTIFQIGLEPNRIDILTAVEGLDFELAWKNRVASTYGEIPIFILGREDLLVNKKTVARRQDLIDVENLESLC